MTRQSRRRRIFAIDRSGFGRYINGPSGVVFPRDDYEIHVIAVGTHLSQNALAYVESSRTAAGADAIVPSARDLAKEVGAPDAVVAVHERDLLRAAALRDEFRAPGLTVEQTLRFRDKVAMKAHLAAAGIRVPRCAPFTVAEGRRLLGRVEQVVVKPRWGYGSAGVHFARSAEQVELLAGSVGGPEDMEVEEFVPGVLHHVDSIVREGRVVAATVSRYLDPTTSFMEPSTTLRSVNRPNGPEADALLVANAEVIASHPYLSGVTHLEAFLTPDGEAVFCEIAARAGGGGIPPAFLARTGADLFATHLRAQAGVLPPHQIPVSEELTGWLLLYAGPGTMIAPPRLPDAGWILDADVYIPPDGVLGTPGDVSQAVVTLAVRGPDYPEVERRLRTTIDEVRRTMIIDAGESDHTYHSG